MDFGMIEMDTLRIKEMNDDILAKLMKVKESLSNERLIQLKEICDDELLRRSYAVDVVDVYMGA